jgi:beta-galactosidase
MKREIMKLTANWLFHLGEAGEGIFPDYENVVWTPVKIPHSWNAADTFVPKRGYYRGIGWYKTRISVDANMMKNKITVEFGAVYGFAEVWMNGVFTGRYLSGYTGFVIDITKEVRIGQDNLLAVRCGNMHDPQILPGREIPDYCLFGGIYREVKLVTASRTGFAWQGTAIQTLTADADFATLKISAKIYGRTAAVQSVAVVICNAASEEIGQYTLSRLSETRFVENITISDPALWHPDYPNLYTAKFELVDNNNKIIDQVNETFGIRTAQFDSQTGFYLNGQPLKLRGVNRHQCYPGLGNALPASLHYEDALLIKKMGANFVRTSHYPQHQVFLDACDRLGLLVYEEIASWQTISGDAFKQSAYEMLQSMILRDINHPSIILWGIMNEGRDRDFFQKMHEIAKSMDPYRDTAYADNRLEEGKMCGAISTTDVLGINYQLDQIDAFHHDYPNYALLVAEYANSCVPRANSAGMINQMLHISEELNLIESREFIAGSALWSFHDYGSDYEFAWPVQLSGVVDAYRLPKYTYLYLAAHWQETPQIYLAGHWTYPGEEGKTRQVVVISNCETIDLYINGLLAGTDKGKEIYVFDVPYQPGTIRAVGRYKEQGDGGFKKNVECQLSTTGAACKLKIDASADRLPADNSEASVLTVRMLDSNDNVVDCSGLIDIKMDHDLGQLFGLGGSQQLVAESGIGRIVFRSGMNKGIVTITAACNGLKSDSCQIELVDPFEDQDNVMDENKDNKHENALHKGQWHFQ